MVLVAAALAGVWYAWAYRRARHRDAIRTAQVWWFGVGLAVVATTAVGPIATYTPILFWVRALQVFLLLYVAPFFLALGRPVATGVSASSGCERAVDRILASRFGHFVLSPAATSIAMLATPWLIYLTPWYVASMSGPLAELTRIMLLVIGFCYFYARLQADPVPHRYTPLLSIGISVAEGLGDGVLGVVLWLGPIVGYDYYSGLHRDWGPSLRVDQAIGAGILWIVGDVFGLVFVLVLMHALGHHERRRAAEVDAELDAAPVQGSGLWWENDPQLRDRFGPR